MTGIFTTTDGIVLATGDRWLTPAQFDWDSLFRSEDPASYLADAVSTASPAEAPDLARPLPPPIASQEVWAAGVTYFRSRDARMEEAEQAGGDVFYDKVYDAERPELFLKANRN